MSHVFEFRRFARRRPGGCVGRDARGRRGRHAAVALTFLLCLPTGTGACATLRSDAPVPVDFTLPDGTPSSLTALAGRVVVLDVCASWAAACNLNARVLDEVRAALPSPRVEVLTLLLDDAATAPTAVRAYADVLEVKHLVVVAGPAVRDGRSVLGDTANIPRLLIFDATGRIVLDATGGIPNVETVVQMATDALR